MVSLAAMATGDPHPATARPDYPYGSRPLVAIWGNRWAQGLALAIAACAAGAIALHAGDWPIHRLALLVVLPALLGITLAFAPDPPSRVSLLAKRLVTAGCAIGTLSGVWLAPMILAVPALLALAVGIGMLTERRDG